MNIPHKFLINNCLSDQKLKFYDKLPIRYSKIITEFMKKKSNYENFKKKVTDWLFNQNEENKMILCSVENKKYTNTIYEAYNYYINNSENVKFKIIDEEDSSDSDKFKLDYNDINFNKYFNKKNYSKIENVKKKNEFLNIHNKLLDSLVFYQCETPINEYKTYSDYFTLNPEILKNEEIFTNECNEISKDQFLNSPIMIERNKKNKNNLYFKLPNWIQNNNHSNNINEKDNENNCINSNNYFTLAQYILALIEQVLSVRYILYNGNKKLEEIITGTYLYDLFDKRKSILSYINSINIESSRYFKYFNIDDINATIFFSQDIEKFIEEKKNSVKKSDNTIESYNENESAFIDIEQIFKNIVEKNKNDKNKFNKELINMCMLIPIDKLFTLDDFFLRSIFEKFYKEYLNQIYNDLMDNKEEKPKKKRKKKKKNNNINNEINKADDNNNEISNNGVDNSKELAGEEKEEISNNENKLVLGNLEEEKINKDNDDKNNTKYNNNNKKDKNNKKEKEFFLYEPIKKKEKKKINNNPNKNKNNNSENNEKKNIIINDKDTNHEENIISNDINNNINKNNSSTNSDSIFRNIFENISNEQLIKLNDDINNFNKDIESLLIIFRKIKKEIKNHFECIIKNIYKNNSQLEIYGSSLYQLDIESSDLDLSISTESNLTLDSLAIYLTNNNHNNQYLNINNINTASIPIIKLEIDYLKLDNDKINNYYQNLINNNYYKNCINNNIYKEFNIIKIDISLKSINYNQINFIQKEIKNFPQIKPMIKILKKLLIFKNMNNSYKGGMSSYCLFLIIYCYLKLYKNIDQNCNYASLLMGFLYHYVNIIDFEYTLINPSLDNPFIISNFPIETIPTIIDPVTMNNAGKIIFRIIDVVNVFNEIYKDFLLIIKEDKNQGNIIYKLFIKYIENSK